MNCDAALVQERGGYRGPHHPPPQLLHQAQGQRQVGRVHYDKGKVIFLHKFIFAQGVTKRSRLPCLTNSARV